MKFEFLDHTADAKFRAYGKTNEEAFENAALAMFSLMTETEKVKPNKQFTIEVQAERLRSLLFDFLEEFIFLIDTEGFLLNKVESLEISKEKNYKLKAVVKGDAGDYEIFTQIKAMTYSDMLIKEENDQVMIQVVVDI